MTQLQLKNFIEGQQIEWTRIDHNVLVFPSFSQLQAFCELIDDYFSDGCFDATIHRGYVGIYMADICDWYNIDIESVFMGDHSSY